MKYGMESDWHDRFSLKIIRLIFQLFVTSQILENLGTKVTAVILWKNQHNGSRNKNIQVKLFD